MTYILKIKYKNCIYRFHNLSEGEARTPLYAVIRRGRRKPPGVTDRRYATDETSSEQADVPQSVENTDASWKTYQLIRQLTRQ